MKKYNLLVAQSGGPTAAINASLSGVIEEAKKNSSIDKIYGAVYGIEGVFNNNILLLNDIDTEILKQTPSAYLGSCRKKMPDIIGNEEFYETVFSFFEKNNIGYFLYIGGNDSMDTVFRLFEYAKLNNKTVKIIGIPKTIDNDLDATDHTPGFGSAAKYIASTVSGIVKDSQVYDLKSVTIIEIMGRNAGWLTAASALARTDDEIAPHLIYLPETSFSTDKFISDIKEKMNSGINNVIVAASEGIRDENGRFISENENGIKDAFGHISLGGAGELLECLVKEKIGCKVRSVELNVCQRCAGFILSKTDIEEAFMIGAYGIKAATSGETGKMMAFKRESTSPYKISVVGVDISKIANVEKKVPQEDIINGNDVSKNLISYLRPLIMGEMELKFENGIPKTSYRKP